MFSNLRFVKQVVRVENLICLEGLSFEVYLSKFVIIASLYPYIYRRHW
jgi:hypothetical protein